MKSKSARIGSKARFESRTDFDRLRQMNDADIDDSDIPKLETPFWKKATLVLPESRRKPPIEQ
jgi:hypothetical protein